ncbi:hypothetical protein CFR78_04370 [Komagataeibacter rhaeticus]|uniref:hypothetical protein n=1 Tax=Komagataeibacter rhaeticus TaxID=215221 RepID=UPI0004D38E20|nr:hypothetical protein [Komagataeibacter rhaeticus]KDU96483.1 hypothetical protein GLUCORHAEAF1_01845 [Komagataeibacter rhaeticus AF1]PYD54210.1 hypothetical protein CFR78_04370 [Komagataeibacter rhaeticus]GBQ15160.1 hypothetical protein AA16663_2006 [Komagataeibacter rhaeticus DSM 16663]
MSDNSKTVAGYVIPASITAQQIKNACMANGYSMMFVARDENPTGMLMHIIEALGHPVFRGVRVETAAKIRVISGANELECIAFNPSVVPDDEYTDVVRRSDMDIARAGDMAALRDMDHKNAALHRTITRLTDALLHISTAPPSIYDARNFRAIARAALREGEAA